MPTNHTTLAFGGYSRLPHNAKRTQLIVCQEMEYFVILREMRDSEAAKQVMVCFKDIIGKISTQTIKRWYDHYCYFGEFPCETEKKRGRNWKTRGKQCKFTEDEWIALKEFLDTEPTLYIDEMVAFMRRTTNKTCSISTMFRLLESKQYSRKKVYDKACQAIQLRKDLFVNSMRTAGKRADMFVFIDESGKGRLDAKRMHGYSRIGKKINRRSVFNRDKRYTLMGAANCYGFITYMCDVVEHEVTGKEVHNTVTGEVFENYLVTKVIPHLGNFLKGEPNSIVVMDNCSVHISDLVRQMIAARGAILLFSAPYACELIPIEPMFHQWKSYLKRHYVAFNEDWRLVHEAALSSISPEQGLEYFKRTTLHELVEEDPLYRATTTCAEEMEEEDELLVLLVSLLD